MGNGQIIIVNGTSGAGKTTTVTKFGERADDAYMMFGIDQLLGQMLPVKFSGFGDRSSEGMHFLPEDPENPDSPLRAEFGSVAQKGLSVFHDMLAAASKAGQNVIADHIMFLNPAVLQDCVWRLKDVPVLFVAVKPPRAVPLARQATRQVELPEQYAEKLGDDARKEIAKNMQRMAAWFYDAAYENDCYDLVIDSDKYNPDEVCEQIEQRIAEGPGTAFETLRGRYQKQ